MGVGRGRLRYGGDDRGQAQVQRSKWAHGRGQALGGADGWWDRH